MWLCISATETRLFYQFYHLCEIYVLYQRWSLGSIPQNIFFRTSLFTSAVNVFLIVPKITFLRSSHFVGSCLTAFSNFSKIRKTKFNTHVFYCTPGELTSFIKRVPGVPSTLPLEYLLLNLHDEIIYLYSQRYLDQIASSFFFGMKETLNPSSRWNANLTFVYLI